jgi:hypothetical protein
MKEYTQKLTLYQPVTYQIKVPGILDESCSDWDDGIVITVEYIEHDQPITILTGTIDQAALHGLLRRLYSLGIPLISVSRVANDSEK